MVNIVIADDHYVVRKGLKALLTSETDFKIIGEAENGLEAVSLVEELCPDILVLDLMMPGINGMEVARRINKMHLATRIIILSMHSNEAYVVEALRIGAKAYVLKDASPEDLIQAIREVLAGRCYLSSPISARLLAAYSSRIEN